MKVGDLVRWTSTNEAWHFANGVYSLPRRKCGVIIGENKRYFFVHWEDSNQRSEEKDWIEKICPGSSAG